MMGPMQLRQRPERRETEPRAARVEAFLGGFSSVFDVFGTIDTSRLADAQDMAGGIAGDWRRVGQDLAAAIEQDDAARR